MHNLGDARRAARRPRTASSVRSVAGRQSDGLGASPPRTSRSRPRCAGCRATLATTKQTLNDVAGLATQLAPDGHRAASPRRAGCPQPLRNSRTLFKGAALLPLEQIPPFIDAVDSRSAACSRRWPRTSRQVEPRRSSPAFKVLTYVTNELAYNPAATNPGFLYWLAWFAHNADSFISTSDAQRPGLARAGAGQLRDAEGDPGRPLLEPLLGTGLLGRTWGVS